ncbi:MAG: hypothetical protein LH609_12425, partial [Rudanella sp.]|nr:hypothetical protein [Rudanella sp.]
MVVCTVDFAYGQARQRDILPYRHFMGTSLWSIRNLFPESADFYELDYGYRITGNDALIVRAITWKYIAPLGIPYGPSFEAKEENYPGYVRAFGLGIGYQRFVWKGLFAAIHAIPFLQTMHETGQAKTQKGFQLFLQAQTGYRVNFSRQRFYIEPSVAFNHWPVNTNLPASFVPKEHKWPNYFLFEPHLN